MEATDVITGIKNLIDQENAAIRKEKDEVQVLNTKISIRRDHIDALNEFVRGTEESLAKKEETEKTK